MEVCHCNANQVISEGRPLVYTTLELRVPGPSFLDPTPMTYRRGVAVLFAGAWRFSERTAAGIQRHLLRPLKALAFAVSSGARRLEARRKLGQLFPSLKGVWILHAGGKNACLFCLIPLSNVHGLEITGDPQVIQGLAQAAPSSRFCLGARFQHRGIAELHPTPSVATV